jgi:uncharacterized protein (AIM24 family)
MAIDGGRRNGLLTVCLDNAPAARAQARAALILTADFVIAARAGASHGFCAVGQSALGVESQMLRTIHSTNPTPTNSTASATKSYSSQCR